jgi:hypothetical protein
MQSSDRSDALVGALHLRFASAPQPGRLFWPGVPRAAEEPPGLCIVLVDGAKTADRLGRLLCRAGAVVLTIHHEYPRRPRESDPLDEAALCWAADHAHELGADPARLLLAGERTCAGSAAWLALRARELGWPGLVGQLLIAPKFARPLPTRVKGVAAATILTAIDGNDDGRRYASVLRANDVRVDEVPHMGPLTDLPPQRKLLAATVRALCSADKPTALVSPPRDDGTGARK